MWFRTTIAALVCGLMPAINGFGQVLQMGLDGVAWEDVVDMGNPVTSTDTGPLLFRNVNEADLVSVKAKISAQTAGFWSQAGVIVRAPNPIDQTIGQENWQAAWSFRAPAGGPFTLQSNSVNVATGGETEINNGNLTANDLTFVRLDNLGGGTFQAYRGSGPDNAIVWTPAVDANMVAAPQTNPNLSGIPLQVGVASGAIGALPGASVLFDWVEIQTTSQTFRDDFNYTRDLATDGLPPGGIWTGIENATAGGLNSRAGDLGGCVVCTWNTNGSGDFNTVGNWMGDVSPAILLAPNRNDTTVVFGAVSVAGPATVYTNKNVTVKQIDFDNATNSYVLGGAGTVTLDSNSGNALINVLNGSHEIQADLILADNVTATAAAGTTLNINASVILNGKTFTTAGAGTIKLNNGTLAVGGAGGGSLVNDGNLSGLAAVEGDYTQTGGGSLAVELGANSVIDVLGSASLDGTLDVSLASGFSPAPGQSYMILNAESVTDNGLALGGDAAGRFRLAIGSNSVSLTAVPEPTAVLLMTLGLAGALGLRRRHRLTEWSGPVRFSPARITGWIIALTVLGSAVADADVLTFGPADEPVTYRDDFDTFFDYEAANGGVPTGTLTSSLGGAKSWTATYNAQNGGDVISFPGFPPTFQANGSYMGTPKPGVLVIEDQVVHPNTDGTLGVGWEGDKNNAPLLFANVDAGDNFQATIKISNQTAGNWSYSGIIARRAGTPVGLGLGDTLDPNETFVTMGSFRTAADDPATTDVDESLNATILTQNIGQLDANAANDPDEVEANDGVVQTGLPLWVRMTKEASRFTASSSLDGINFTTRNMVINPGMNSAGQMLEIGPSHMAFPGGVLGTGEFDSFEITVSKQQIFQDARWTPVAAGLGSGNWNNGNNWDSDSAPGQIPNVNTVNVELGDGNATFGPATVYNNSAVTIRSLTFNSPNKYAVSGAGSITLEPYSSHATDPTATFINVNSGQHEIQLKMGLSSAASTTNNRINALPGTRLDINNSFDLNGKTMTIQGGGTVNFNNNIDLPTSGTILVSGGVLGGSGRINGTVTNGDASNPGTVSPGTSIGTLTIEGTGSGTAYSQAASGILKIELGGTGAGQFDVLNVIGGNASIRGKVDVSLADGYVPQINDTWEIIKVSGGILSTGFALDASDSPYYSLTVSSANHNVILKLIANPMTGVIGDYNGDNKVDAADYTVWRDHLGTSFVLTNRDPANSGNVSAADYTAWKSHFGQTSPGSGAGGVSLAVPEPATVLLLVLGTVMAGISSRRRL